MNLSLREEIKEWIGLNSDPNYVTDKIIQLIEKQIDEMIPDNHEDLEPPLSFYATGYAVALYALKDELKK